MMVKTMRSENAAVLCFLHDVLELGTEKVTVVLLGGKQYGIPRVAGGATGF